MTQVGVIKLGNLRSGFACLKWFVCAARLSQAAYSIQMSLLRCVYATTFSRLEVIFSAVLEAGCEAFACLSSQFVPSLICL